MNRKLIQEVFKARPKMFIAMGVLVAVNICLYLYVSVYQGPHLASLQNKWFKQRQEASGGVTQDAAAIYRQGAKDLQTWNSRIAPKKDFARFLGTLFETAANNSLGIGTVTYKPEILKDEKLLVYSINFDVNGKYASVKSFIADLARLRDIITVNDVSLNNSNQTEELVGMKLKLTAYFRMEG